MKKWIIFSGLLDAVFIVVMISILIWWENTHTRPGLSELLNVKMVWLCLIVAVIFFAIIIGIGIYNSHRK